MLIKIVEHQRSWKDQFNTQKEKISKLIGFLDPAIVHIGSTSVAGLCAKPTIDIQVGLRSANDLDKTIVPMKSAYTYVKLFEPGWPSRRFYCRFVSETGNAIPQIIDIDDPEPVKQGLTSLVNIHVFVIDTDDWIRHIGFRDYLAAHRSARDDYGQLKMELSKRDFENMVAYNDAKSDFIKETQQKAMEWYHNSRGNL